MVSTTPPPNTPGKATYPPAISDTPCLRASQLLPGNFYQAKIIFHYTSINEPSPLKRHLVNLPPGDTPRFRLDHLDRGPNHRGQYDVARKSGKNCTRPVLVVSVDADIVNILICSTTPNQLNIKRWVPFEGTTRYPQMPDAVVTTNPANAMNKSGEGSVCVSHIFRTRPLVENESGEPKNLLAPGISHIHESRPVQVPCTNMQTLQRLHFKYWNEADNSNGGGTGGGGDQKGKGKGTSDAQEIDITAVNIDSKSQKTTTTSQTFSDIKQPLIDSSLTDHALLEIFQPVRAGVKRFVLPPASGNLFNSY